MKNLWKMGKIAGKRQTARKAAINLQRCLNCISIAIAIAIANAIAILPSGNCICKIQIRAATAATASHSLSARVSVLY